MGNTINQIMFPRPTPPGYSHNFPHIQHTATSEGRRLAFAVIRPSPRHDTKRAVVYSHGNAEDLGSVVPYLQSVVDQWGATVFCYDYASYGTSTGSPSEEAVLADVETIAAIAEKDFARSQTFLYGRSLGSGPTCHLAAKARSENQPYLGVVLQSPFLSAFRVALPKFMWWTRLPGDKFTNYEKLQQAPDGFGAPVFIVHGERDEVIGVHHGKVLSETVPA